MKSRTTLLSLLVAFSLSACTATTTMDNTRMSDAEVAGLVRTANDGEIQHGEIARTRAQNSAVRDFASMMVTDHTRSNEQLQQLLADRGMSTADAPQTVQLRQSAAATAAALDRYSGADFDRAYMRSQVELHQWLLTTLDGTLIPSARDRQLRAQLQAMRGAVAAHLNRAQQIAGSI